MPDRITRAATPAPAGNAIDIWLANYQEWDDESALARLHPLLSHDEHQRRARFHFHDDRLRYLVTRAMVRTVLSRYAPVAPVAWRFTVNPYGRPAIAAGHTAASGLAFNVSHTQGLIALGVTRHAALGVDVESLHGPARPELAEHWFSQTENTDLRLTPPAARGLRFYEYWTFKEAYIKARGMGLSLPLDQFSFRFPEPTRVCMEIDPAMNDDPARWRLWQFRLNEDFLLAVCAERDDAASPWPTLRKLTSLNEHEVLALTPTKFSDQPPTMNGFATPP